MSYVVSDQVVLSEEPEGPLAAYLVPFVDSLSHQGYTRRYIHRQVMLAACFSRWLKKIDLSLGRVTSAHAAHYLERIPLNSNHSLSVGGNWCNRQR